MIDIDVLGYKNEPEYFDYFFDTLLPTNRTYDYYVNWEKVKGNVVTYLTEISLLNSLTKIDNDNREEKFVEIISKYPEVIPVIPLIIAIREKNVVVLDIGEQLFYKKFKFNQKLKTGEILDIVEFCKKSGILDLFGEINDLYAYLLGMEVGLDSNARKNRSGKIFEQLVGLLLKDKVRDRAGFILREEDSSLEIKRNKRADFVIYHNNIPKIAIECNFYSSTGSKPIEVANAYIDLNRKCKDENLKFIWVTDGPGWLKMRNTVEKTFREIDFPMNYTIIDEKMDSFLKALEDD
ncbi:type II restriction-modification system, restriction enzyme [Methanobacterium sp. MB1]|nr:type II restriction-modification system, restriction enzyme [Methanobacterium sp. MB1]